MENKKTFINENLNLVPLSTTSYSNLKYADRAKNDSVNKALLDDINAAAKSIGVVATITTAKTGHNKLVKSGKSVSRHMNGTGVDIRIINNIEGNGTNATNGSPEFRAFGTKLKDALVSMGYKHNVESGNDKAVLWQTNTGGNHFNHLHISNRTGLTSGQPTVSPTSGDQLTAGGGTSTGGGATTSQTSSDIQNRLSASFKTSDDKAFNKPITEEINRIKELML